MVTEILTAFGDVTELPGQLHVSVDVTPGAEITVWVPERKRECISVWLCVRASVCVQHACVREFLCVFIILPAEVVTSQPQLSGLRTPCVVELVGDEG